MNGKVTLMILGAFLFVAGPAHAGDASAGQAKAEECANCHGEDGKGDSDNPPIAGMAEADFIKVLKDYKSGARTKNKAMIKASAKLSDDDIANLAAYYATLK
ncbi:MAG TPA: c-type cytochrome [Thiobacillaceae bacterium]|nr:c-type cytochrome [Thiobacillaceae bacterium]